VDEPVAIETVPLKDGETIRVRRVLPSDKPHFKSGIARLSRESRYFRFLSPKRDLSDSDLRYLTEFDGEDHYALCAYREREDGSEEGIGVARFVRLPQAPDTAEVAITVIDSWQRRGVGHILYDRLVKAARVRGIRILRSEVHERNTGILRLLEATGADPVVTRAGPILTLEVTI